MRRSLLYDMLEKYKFMQYIIGVFPIIAIVTYISFYMYDFLSVYEKVVKTSALVEKDLSDNSIVELSDKSVMMDINDNYVANITQKQKDIIDISAGGSVYKLYYFGDFFRVDTVNTSFYLPSVSYLTDIEVEDGGIVKMKVGEYETEVYMVENYLCELALNDDGGFVVRLPEEEVGISVEKVDGVSILFSDSYLFTVEVSGNFMHDIKTKEIYYTTILPTNNFYFDYKRGMLCKNVPKSMAKDIIIGTKYSLVMFSMLAYFVLLFMCYRTDAYSVLKRKEFLYLDGFMLLMLPMPAFLTFILLK